MPKKGRYELGCSWSEDEVEEHEEGVGDVVIAVEGVEGGQPIPGMLCQPACSPCSGVELAALVLGAGSDAAAVFLGRQERRSGDGSVVAGRRECPLDSQEWPVAEHEGVFVDDAGGVEVGDEGEELVRVDADHMQEADLGAGDIRDDHTAVLLTQVAGDDPCAHVCEAAYTLRHASKILEPGAGSMVAKCVGRVHSVRAKGLTTDTFGH